MCLAGATEKEVGSQAEMADILSQGSMLRATGSTQMNKHSSRSHAIFTITLEQRREVSVGHRKLNNFQLREKGGGGGVGGSRHRQTYIFMGTHAPALIRLNPYAALAPVQSRLDRRGGGGWGPEVSGEGTHNHIAAGFRSVWHQLHASKALGVFKSPWALMNMIARTRRHQMQQKEKTGTVLLLLSVRQQHSMMHVHNPKGYRLYRHPS